jgi:diketogulonate reductase-like aldo/keto reductase
MGYGAMQLAVCVQNNYNVATRYDRELVDRCTREGIAYTPFFPLGGFNICARISPLPISSCQPTRSTNSTGSALADVGCDSMSVNCPLFDKLP